MVFLRDNTPSDKLKALSKTILPRNGKVIQREWIPTRPSQLHSGQLSNNLAAMALSAL